MAIICVHSVPYSKDTECTEMMAISRFRLSSSSLYFALCLSWFRNSLVALMVFYFSYTFSFLFSFSVPLFSSLDYSQLLTMMAQEPIPQERIPENAV